jgi:hypothetical protein
VTVLTRNVIATAWTHNRQTFGSGAQAWSGRDVALYYIALCILSGAAAALATPFSADMLIGILTAIAIFAGFTFAILIFFVDHRFKIISDETSLKQQSLQEKIDRLTSASFNVIFYFGILTSIIAADCVGIFVLRDICDGATTGISRFFPLTDALGRAFLFALLCETSVTFYRLMRRLRYLFQKVRQLAG